MGAWHRGEAESRHKVSRTSRTNLCCGSINQDHPLEIGPVSPPAARDRQRGEGGRAAEEAEAQAVSGSNRTSSP